MLQSGRYAPAAHPDGRKADALGDRIRPQAGMASAELEYEKRTLGSWIEMMPSRFMRRAVGSGQTPVRAWAVLVALVSIALYLLYLHPYAVGAFAIAITIRSWFTNVHYRKKFAHLAKSREGESICDFAKAFESRDTDTWVIRAVYEELQRGVEGFGVKLPIRPDDSLQEIFAVDPDALDFDIAPRIAERTGRDFSDLEANPLYGKITSAADMVRFFNRQPVTVPKHQLLERPAVAAQPLEAGSCN